MIRCEFDLCRADVLFQTMQLGCTRNGDDPRLLSEQPGKCDLRRCRFLLCSKSSDQIYDGLICLQGLRREAGQVAADIGLIKLCPFVNLAGEKTSAKRAERDKAYAQLLEHG